MLTLTKLDVQRVRDAAEQAECELHSISSALAYQADLLRLAPEDFYGAHTVEGLCATLHALALRLQATGQGRLPQITATLTHLLASHPPSHPRAGAA